MIYLLASPQIGKGQNWIAKSYLMYIGLWRCHEKNLSVRNWPKKIKKWSRAPAVPQKTWKIGPLLVWMEKKIGHRFTWNLHLSWVWVEQKEKSWQNSRRTELSTNTELSKRKKLPKQTIKQMSKPVFHFRSKPSKNGCQDKLLWPSSRVRLRPYHLETTSSRFDHWS